MSAAERFACIAGLLTLLMAFGPQVRFLDRRGDRIWQACVVGVVSGVATWLMGLA
ncbi:MAG: hypothetical protein K9G48_15440 [Reyranella sp.]|nr:hypothetical protein [Reyranella sp.]